MMPSTTTNLCQAKASYKKTQGLLELTKTHLQWTASGKQTPDLKILNNQAASLFCSKEGSPQVKLKLGLVGNDAGYTFQFTSSQAVVEREAFKKELTNIIGNNRANGTPVPESAAATPKPNGTPSITPTARSVPSVSRATSVSSSNDRASSAAPSGATDDFRLRKKVLLKNTDLAALHKELVMSSQITESEFWEGREHLLLAEATQENQKRGRAGQIVDPRPETTASGDVKIVITPQLVHDIFEEYPVVAKAYSETVPKQLSEAEFWKRYFQSKLFNSHRASVRSSAAQHVVKDDPIFDKYVEKNDDALEPRNQRDNDVDIFVNLFATQEDRVETGNQKDPSMRAGTQKGALPLIRKFNEHSERLLNAAEGSPNKKRRLGEDTEQLYAEIDLEDLHASESNTGIVLEMKDRDRYFDGRASGVGQQSAEESGLPFRSVLPDIRVQINEWSSALSALKIGKKAGDNALLSMTQNVQARLEVKMRKNDIPEALYQEMRTSQTAANEFLRQFWSAIYPPPSDLAAIASSTPAQRNAKAAKMADYLAKTPEKVEAIIQEARAQGVDAAKIEVAMKPVLTAVEKALEFNKNRRHVR